MPVTKPAIQVQAIEQGRYIPIVQTDETSSRHITRKLWGSVKLFVNRLKASAALIIPKSKLVLSVAPLLPFALLSTSASYAADGIEAISVNNVFKSTDILMLAVFAGAMSFALMSAIWLIRERAKLGMENTRLKETLSQLHAKQDRNEALLNSPEQRIVVWNGSDERPTVMGSLNKLSGCPEKKGSFLSFGSWLSSESSARFEPAMNDLRSDAKSFDMVITSRNGGVLEAQGRTSGSHAHIRFRELSGEREEYARMKYNFANLQSQFRNIELLCEKLPMPVWFCDVEGKLTWVNQCYADAVEAATPVEVISENVVLFDKEHVGDIRRVHENQSAYHKTIPATISGDRKRIEVFSVKGAEGSAGIAFDRSDLENLTRTLSEVKDGHSRMLDQIETAVAIFDKSQKLIFCNSGFQKLWNIDPVLIDSGPTNGELLDAMRDAKLLPEHPDWRNWRQNQLEVYKAIDPVNEWWHLLNGQTVHVTATPRTEGGANWIFQNVTEQLALESNNKTLVRMQGETLDHLNEAVAVFASDGKLRLFNPALEALWTASEIDVVEGLHIAKIISAWNDTVSNVADLENILGKVTGFDDERSDLSGRLEMQSGSTFEYTLVPLPEGQSMLTLTDVTASVNFEKALRERAEALEASDHLKSKFIQHVSYELRAPLTSIVGFGEMLATPELGKLNEQQSEYLSYINTSAEELSTIVGDILDLASVDAGTMTLEFEQVNFASLVARTLEAHDTTMQERSIKADIKINSSSVELVADEYRLRQVIDNLVSNAISFSPDGGTVTIEAKMEEGSHIIRISDEGPGVSDELKEAIFDRFEARSTDGSHRGTGLGLSIVRSFVELHGGNVSVHDAPDRGSCFICQIPVKPHIFESPGSGGYITQAAQ